MLRAQPNPKGEPMRFRITLALETAMPEADVESWTLELLEDAREHLLADESIQLESVEAA
jgi:hypothetical protein